MDGFLQFRRCIIGALASSFSILGWRGWVRGVILPSTLFFLTVALLTFFDRISNQWGYADIYPYVIWDTASPALPASLAEQLLLSVYDALQAMTFFPLYLVFTVLVPWVRERWTVRPSVYLDSCLARLESLRAPHRRFLRLLGRAFDFFVQHYAAAEQKPTVAAQISWAYDHYACAAILCLREFVSVRRIGSATAFDLPH